MIGDVHSNLEAFETVIRDAGERGGFDQIWSLGDLIGYGPDPVACIDLLRQYDYRAVVGNHDLASIGRRSLEAFNTFAAETNRWTSSQLTEDHVSFLMDLPLKLEIGEFTLVHGSPRDPIWEYVVSVPTAVASFMHFDTYQCLLSHSHIPFICRPKEDGAMFLEFPENKSIKLGTNRLIINPGGLGQPRDGDPRTSYALYDSNIDSITHYRVEYEYLKTQEKMKLLKLPEFLINRLGEGR